MATEWGARCSGWPQTGILKLGMQADLIFLRLHEPDFQPLISTSDFSDVLQNLIFDGRSEWIEHVMVAGNWKVKNRQLCGLDETQLIAKQRQLMKKLVAETLK
ncbi:amidohydrolase family protein [Holdemania massiliensis]|uniref:amidohydrolase family protein n=1 Tax=Holdemania massiliensis TaxID=1468449 RepID=UPI003562343D